jgi:hypothetical protein
VAAVGPLGLDPAPDADEGILVPLAPDRGLLAVARVDDQLVRQAHQDVHDRAAKIVESVLRPADRAGEERVAGEDGLAVDDERQHPTRVTRRSQRLDAQVARLDDLAVPERLGPRHVLVGGGEHAQAEPLHEQLVVGDMVGVGVGREEERRLRLQPVDGREERLDGGPRVDEDRGSAHAVGDEVGVRQPAGVHAPFDDHGVGSMPADVSVESRRTARSR